jgi:hypothetical protein
MRYIIYGRNGVLLELLLLAAKAFEVDEFDLVDEFDPLTEVTECLDAPLES